MYGCMYVLHRKYIQKIRYYPFSSLSNVQNPIPSVSARMKVPLIGFVASSASTVRAPVQHGDEFIAKAPAHAVTTRRFANRRARLFMSTEDASNNENESGLTVGDVFREWKKANGEVSMEKLQESDSIKNARFEIMFVDRDNCTISPAAEAIFSDLVQRRNLQDKIQCYSSGVKAVVGSPADLNVIEGLAFRRKLDISHHSAVEFEPQDVASYDLIICADERVKSQVLYLIADSKGKHDDEIETKVRVLSSYCSKNSQYSTIQFPSSGKYTRDSIKVMLSALVDACTNLLFNVVEQHSKS
mmetsp:Transcript_610/g.1063  ORF Transcript_610/g.1063 Transcript_610/m.1063 type:complete len:300 (+) Transcript_610:213-1112(+)